MLESRYDTYIHRVRILKGEYERGIRFPHLAHLHVMVALQKPIGIARSWLRKVFLPPSFAKKSYSAIFTDNLEAAAEHFREHWCAFVEDIFPSEFHSDLIAQFLAQRLLNPPLSIYKAYDIGLQWRRGRGEPKLLSKFPAYEALFCILAL